MSIITKILDGLKVAKFVKLVVKDCKGYESQPYYAEKLVKSILDHKEELPKCLKSKSEYAMMVEILTEILDWELPKVEAYVKTVLN